MNQETNNTMTLIFSNFDKDHFMEMSKDRFDFSVVNGLEQQVYLVSPSSTMEAFTTKEKKVLQYLKNGLRYAQIAAEMNMTTDGVRYYTKKIYRKLGVNNSRQAIAKVY